MSYYLSKVLPMLFLPVSMSLGASMAALILMYRGRRRGALAFLLAAIGILWTFSLPGVAGALMWSLERQYLPLKPDDVPTADCIVVLGGALGAATAPRVSIELTDSVDRVYRAAELYRSHKGRTVIVAAGNQPWQRDLVPEAQLIRTLLMEWGVPGDFILLDTASRNTRENALNAAVLIQQAECQSSLLVTSAWHMPRAAAAFSALGVPVHPVAADVRYVHGRSGNLAGLIPRADALASSSQAILEWMGIWVYRWRGWG